jgi:hypothetical protein
MSVLGACAPAAPSPVPAGSTPSPEAPTPVSPLQAPPTATTQATATATRAAATTAPATAAPTPSSTQAPLPTPTLIPLPALPEGGSKLGVHGIWSNHITQFARALAEAGAPFRIVKAVDDLGWLKEIKQISPETITVGRLTHGEEGAQRVNDPNTDLDAYASLLMDPILAKVNGDPALRQAVDYWELTNEPLGGGAPAEAYARLARLSIAALDIAEANGLKLALFGFSAGTPEWADMVAIVETGVFARAKAGGHILALHEGVFGADPITKWWNTHNVDENGNPTTQETGVTAPGGWIPGGPVLEGAGALNMRYRFFYHLLQQRDEVVPLFVSEFYAGGSYDPSAKADVIYRMVWYDTQIAADDYVLGFGPFTLGPVPGWEHQNYEPFYTGLDGLVAYMAGGTERARAFVPVFGGP